MAILYADNSGATGTTADVDADALDYVRPGWLTVDVRRHGVRPFGWHRAEASTAV